MGEIRYLITSDESALVEKLKTSDKTAFEEIYFRYSKQLKTFACFELKDEALAEDAVHEIFLKLWLKRETLDNKLSVKGFLFTCLKNHILNAVRTKKNEILKHIRISRRTSNTSNATENTFLTSEYQALIQSSVNDLPEKKQAIFELSVYKGWPSEKIAKDLKIPLNTVKMYLSQSTRQIKSLIKEK